ncbi:MAG: LssY C-terminal domain-containing protein [Rhodospirillales bacterium]
MTRPSACRCALTLLILLSTAPLRGAVLPASTELEIRLKTRVASSASKADDPVEAVLIRPVVIGGEIAVPAGTELRGRVKEVLAISKPDQRAVLGIEFLKLGGVNIEARVTAVDNARESVDETGRIVGILASETIAARLSEGVDRVAEKYRKLGGFLQVVTTAVFKESEPEIVYEPGVEMKLALVKAVDWKGKAAAPVSVDPVSPEDEICALVNSQPWQTTTEGQQPIPSDITNLMFIGSEEQLTKAFDAAGWATAAALNASSGLEVVRAVVESRGYKEAPMSVLLLEGKKPDLVFQKQNNTFAMRHHLRIWRRPGEFQGRAVWVCAATHDIGIEFSPEQRNFIHKIDSQIDRERAKVVSDLLFAGSVQALSLVERPEVPKLSQNATGDKLETDGRMAVLLLK